ncbi:MAG: 1-deoxy-D-xylulose-5-phosphate reductoisomerase [Bacilli bacterium]|nr:1-deoxy-D-xylulose-5-phosphate reductoisomerase [Bacilli bacterium]
MKKVLLLGASGSIGSQTLDIIDKNLDKFSLVAFSVGKRSNIIPDLLKKYPAVKDVYLINEKEASILKDKYPNINFYSGELGLREITEKTDYNMCVDALVGFAGMEPAVIALQRNKILCLANKEALVTGGTIINKLLIEGHGKLYPIDSEHVALAKCLSRVNKDDVKRLVITASGGALRNMPLAELKNAKAEDALKHPTWNMGAKITIDSATMMNKGFEIIEAYYLFGYGLDKIKVLMHDESLVHSAVELKDGTFVLDYGKPDMHVPIEYAMFEGKVDFDLMHVKTFDELKDCHFHEYNPARYLMTELAKKCLSLGASKMIALNAANEVAVYRFLDNKIGYLDIHRIVSTVVEHTALNKEPSLEEIKQIDKASRMEASRL